jgi:hypothetical protein
MLVAWAVIGSTVIAMKSHPPGAIASLVFGILALLTWFVPAVGFVLGVLAIVCSRRAQSARRELPEVYAPGDLHTAGLVIGLVGLSLALLAILWFFFVVGLLGAVGAAIGEGMSPLPPAPAPLLW